MSAPSENAQIYFEVYVGNDLTSGQTIKPAVVFDENLNNLTKKSSLISTAALKTVAYVYAQNGMQVVYAPTADQDATGGGRRVLLVNSSNSGDAGPDLDTALIQEGLLALANQREVYAFDGELPAEFPYIYGQDYNLGDLVEERSSDGVSTQLLVAEQIFSSDDTGEKSYPTLAVAQIITPGSWSAWTDGTYWNDVPTADTWATP